MSASPLAERGLTCGYYSRMNDSDRNTEELQVSWRAFVFGPLATVLFFAALWLNDGGTAVLGIILLSASFTLVMVWVMLAARATNNPNSPLTAFIPKLTAFLVLCSGFLAATRWKTDKRISAIELGFAAFYILAGYLANRTLDAKHKPPPLKAVTRRRR